MQGEDAFTVRAARPDEFEAAVEVQHRAFMRVATEIGIDPGILPPVSETAEDVRSLVGEGGVLLVAVTPDPQAVGGERVVGTVRGVPGASATVEIGRLAVEDGFEGLGMGRALMNAVEAEFPQAERFELFTGREAARPLHLYETLGYTIMHDEEVVPNVHIVWLEKCRPPRVDSQS